MYITKMYMYIKNGGFIREKTRKINKTTPRDGLIKKDLEHQMVTLK